MSAHDHAMDSLVGKRSAELLSILRIVAAYMFMLHGTQKLFDFPVASFGPFELMTLAPGLAGILELFGGALLLVGLFTRPVAFLLSGLMAFAYWMSHAFREGGFWLFPISNGGDSSILYCFAFLYIAAAGGGAWALDNVLRKG